MNERVCFFMAILGACAVPHPPIILPEIGKGEEKKIQATINAYREVAAWAVAQQPDVIVITSPHAQLYADYFHISPGKKAAGDFSQFGVPKLQLQVNYDAELVQEIERLAAAEHFPAGTFGEKMPALDHGTMIPLYFLQQAGYTGPIVRAGFSGLSNVMHYHFGEIIAQAAANLGRKVVFVASGDLSHKLKEDGPYGFAADGPVFDARMQECFASGDFLKLLTTPADLAENAAECGLRSFWIMAGALDRKAVQAECLSHEGTFGVGYGVGRFIVTGDDATRNFGEQAQAEHEKEMARIRENEDVYVRLARYSLETFIKSNSYAAIPKDLPENFYTTHAGAFVSLKKDGKLRGCIGTFLPMYKNLAEEICYNAIAAGTRDPRFSGVDATELKDIVYDVDVLSAPELIESKARLDPKKYGVIVESNGRRGLLLPDLAGVDTVDQQIDIARRKGNIGKYEKLKLYRFTVERHV